VLICFVVQAASMKIWAFFAAAFWVSLVTYYVLLKAYKHILKLRVQHESSQTAEPQQYAALVRDIPKPGAHETHTEQVDTFFRQLHPGTYEKCIIICKLKKVRFMASSKVALILFLKI